MFRMTNENDTPDASSRARPARPTQDSTQSAQDAQPTRQPFFATLWKYCGVSLTQTFVELGAFALLSLALQSGVANGCAIVCSATYQFLMNRNLTFKSTSNFWRSVALFVCMWLFNFAFSTFMLATLPASFGLDPLLVKIITMGCQGVWGFLLSRYVIFR